MKKLLVGVIVSLLMLVGASRVSAAGLVDSNKGVPLYVIIEVGGDISDGLADWTVWGPAWSPEVGGTQLTGCVNCLDANYDFVFKGKTVQFDEVFVNTVVATPQVKHVVLHDLDGDGTYTGSETTHYFPWVENSGTILYFDRIDYDVKFDEDGNLLNFHYLQYEHKKLE